MKPLTSKHQSATPEAVGRCLFSVILLFVTGCATYHPQPISPEKAAARLESNRLAADLVSTGRVTSPPAACECQFQSDLATASTTRMSQPEYPSLSLSLRPNDDLQLAAWNLENPPRLQLASVDTEAAATTTVSTNKESLFSMDYWKLVGLDAKETVTAPARWDTRDWLVFGGVTVGVGVTMVFDQDIQKDIQRNRNGTINDISNAVQPLGNEYAPAVAGAFYVGGEIFNDPRATSVGLDGLSASIIASGLILQPLKYAVGRSRPGADQGAYDFKSFGGSDSFPSGHTTEAFALATVISEHYDSVWVKLASYGMASAVGYARLNNNAHWASDVLAGAALGTFVGHVVVRYNQQHRDISLQPVFGPDMKGAQISFSF
jgi:hypothetical protein